MFDIFLRVNDETLMVAEQVSMLDCGNAAPPTSELLGGRRLKWLPVDLDDFDRASAVLLPVMQGYRAFSDEAVRDLVAECLKYMIFSNRDEWLKGVDISALRGATLAVTVNGDGMSYFNNSAASQWSDVMAMAKMEFETDAGVFGPLDPVYTHVPKGTTADSYAVVVTVNGITHPLKRATPRAMRSVMEYFQKIIFPKMAAEALALPKLPPRDVHMVVLTQEMLRASRTFAEFEDGLDGLRDAPHGVKIAATTLMGCAAKLITTEVKKLNRADRTRLRGTFIAWEFEEPGDDVYECWLGEELNITRHPFTVTMNFVLTGPESRQVRLFTFPTPAFGGPEP